VLLLGSTGGTLGASEVASDLASDANSASAESMFAQEELSLSVLLKASDDAGRGMPARGVLFGTRRLLKLSSGTLVGPKVGGRGSGSLVDELSNGRGLCFCSVSLAVAGLANLRFGCAGRAHQLTSFSLFKKPSRARFPSMDADGHRLRVDRPLGPFVSAEPARKSALRPKSGGCLAGPFCALVANPRLGIIALGHSS